MRRDKKLLQDLSLLLPLGTVLILLGRGISCPGDIGEKSAVRERNEKKNPLLREGQDHTVWPQLQQRGRRIKKATLLRPRDMGHI